MKIYTYAVCPHCEHPNVHVQNGRIMPHTVSLASSTECSGSKLEAMETHADPIERHTLEYEEAFTKACGQQSKYPEEPSCFITWSFSGLRFIAVPGDRNSFHIMDSTGNNYGAWMTAGEFRKRQQSGIIADWQSLGKAHLNVVSER